MGALIEENREYTGFETAIIGMAGRFPGARTIGEFWENLRAGIESISFFTDEEIEAALGFKPRPRANHVKAGAILEGIELFDASFFGFTPKEADVMDPQFRFLLECAWEALENAGYCADKYDGAIGMFAGATGNGYLIFNILQDTSLVSSMGEFHVSVLNEKDHLPTLSSYKLNLKGPSVNVQTACSTSLVAVHLASQALISGECDMVLAGGVSITVPQKLGYFHESGGINSPDGHCRPFDASAQGTLHGNGAGLVVLKRLSDALADHDFIHAIIKGSAINNDGSAKVGYTAPSIEGQANVIKAAQAVAGVDPLTISYVEAHGTGTPLGDPIEVAALTRAFGDTADRRGYCAIGSVKSNIGHLDAAAGVAGLIKTALALQHRELPPSINFETPNPKIDFAGGPFYVNARLRDWITNQLPRRAGVSSFGVGGTNAHVVLEEAPSQPESKGSRRWQLLTISAKSPAALDAATENLARYIKDNVQINLSDVAYTLQIGRKDFTYRRFAICEGTEDAAECLTTPGHQSLFEGVQEVNDPPIAFMFPGGGAQYVDMGRDLYESEPEFQRQVDECCELLEIQMGLDLRNYLFPSAEFAGAAEKIRETFIALPALFVIEYALARLLMSWGVNPQAMIGHSLGEYVAACLSGVFSLRDALAIVVARGRLFQKLESGAMLSVNLSCENAAGLLSRELSLAAINAPELCVISGTTGAIDKLSSLLDEKGTEWRRLHIDVAAHSIMVEEILEEFNRCLLAVELQAPSIPFLSNVTGTWITPEDATDSRYWVRHLRETVKFSDGVTRLMQEPSMVLLEVGPGQTLGTLARLQKDYSDDRIVLATMRQSYQQVSDEAFVLTTLGKLWLAGVDVDWRGFHLFEHRRRLPLPTYPFERQYHWIESKRKSSSADDREKVPRKKSDIMDWLYVPVWKQSISPAPLAPGEPTGSNARWLVFRDDCGVGALLIDRLRSGGHDVIAVAAGKRFARLDDDNYEISPRSREDYASLIQELSAARRSPDRIVHLWCVPPDMKTTDESLDLGCYSLLFIAQALARHNIFDSIQVDFISTGLQRVTSADEIHPAKAGAIGPLTVIPQEYPNIKCRSIDVDPIEESTPEIGVLLEQLLAELAAKPIAKFVAYRKEDRWIKAYEQVRSHSVEIRDKPRLRPNGVYIITGGLGLIGLDLAEHLAQRVQARLVLTTRSPFPRKTEWAQWLDANPDDNAISKKIRRVQSLEQLGAEVLVISADAANREQMKKAFAAAYRTFGTVHGIIHAAGIVDQRAFQPIRDTTRSDCEVHFRPKLKGVMVLEELLRGRELDFCLLISSISVVLGGLGFSAYAAANSFMDAFACKQRRDGRRFWVSAAWDGWVSSDQRDGSSDNGTDLARLSMTAPEGFQVFEQILSLSTVPTVVVSTSDLQPRMDRWVGFESLADVEISKPASESARRHKRGTAKPYAPPSNQVESKIAEIWQEMLGVEQVGIHDDFFELGGHSLLAVKLIANLRETFKVDIPLISLLEAPTVSHIALAVDRAARPA